MSLRDLATLTKRLFSDFPEYSHFFALPEFRYRGFYKKNYHPLIKEHYEGVLGGKTGFTNLGGFGAVGIVKRGNRRLIAVVNKANSSKQRAAIIRELLDYGFEKYKKVTIFNKDQVVTKIPVAAGSISKVEAIITKKVEFNIPADISNEDIKIRIEHQTPLQAPISKNDVIAVAKVKIKNIVALEYPLVSNKTITEATYGDKILKALSIN